MKKRNTLICNNTIRATFLGIVCIGLGVIGYMYIEDYSFVDALYMTLITVSTVGFGEVHSLSPNGKLFTVVLIAGGLGVIGYLISSYGKGIVDGLLAKRYRNFRTIKSIKKMKDHVILVGCGRNGRQALDDLIDSDKDVVVVDDDQDRLDMVKASYPDLRTIMGDATVDQILIEAGICHAGSIIITIPRDAENLYVVLTARDLNKQIKIISRSSNANTARRLRRAGADNVIMPDKIGGSRMAKLVLHPEIVEFIDTILLQSAKEIGVAAVDLKDILSDFNGKSLSEINFRNATGASIIGLSDESGRYVFNPPASTIITNKMKLFVLASPEQHSNICKLLFKG